MTKIGFSCSCFDLLHAGHAVMLEESKKYCSYLIVGLQTDPTLDRPEKNKPIQSLLERQLQLRACKYIDEVIVYETESDLETLLKTLPIDIRFVGQEYINKDYTGKGICESRGVEVFYNSRLHEFSSSELRKRIQE